MTRPPLQYIMSRPDSRNFVRRLLVQYIIYGYALYNELRTAENAQEYQELHDDLVNIYLQALDLFDLLISNPIF